jgi:hypothetical protein
VLRHAWSVRFIAIAGLLSGIEAALPMFGFQPSPWLSGVTLLVVTAAFVARIIVQRNLK